ncbi:alpha-1,2-fucosyltransferase [Phycicoccus sp. CSK15P-2]|uniref:alpha-1,2-fucosyltransferase n=1 Tax=Phycicoccus sp. CSK15P-2 TaxID=2807627 RepID=UPI001952310A|nr:alpha-1,2-fucosyltransferase [Phycicoccus sp. CSK15P-2]MBM6404299.1 alpha-1,2-fucosyltransferase [Phycicoccus sp. CSK15P-2]
MPLVSDAKARLLGLVRRGPRTVLWTRPEYGLGNLLYLLMHAHARRGRGEDVLVRSTPTLERWLPLVPAAQDLVVAPGDVRLTDRRDVHPPFRWGRDWAADELDRFQSDVLAGSPLLDPEGTTALGPDDVVVVVRRGDYWSVPEHRATYAFDTVAYVRAAMALQREVGGPVPRVHVVSDGPRWCRAHLGWLEESARLTFVDPDQTPRAQLATLAGASRLVVTNTTFGYWGGYLAGHRSGRPELVVAPRFHARGPSWGSVATQLDPRWTVLEEIPGGWDEPPPDPWDAGDDAPA